MDERSFDEQLSGVASLRDPRRRALYRCVVERGPGVGRDEAAAAVGVSRALAAYHLDRLVDDGLLTARYERTGAKRGPGAGRPAKLYERSPRQFQVQLPPRDYELAARLFAGALDDDTTGDPHVALLNTARNFGKELGRSARARHAGAPSAQHSYETLLEVMRDLGYEPVDVEECIRLRNCPFHTLAAEHRALVCGMNLALVEGLVDGLDAGPRPVLDPRPGECCVTVHRHAR